MVQELGKKNRACMLMTKTPMDDHHELVESHHRFATLTVCDEVWEFDHLEAFAMKVPVELSPNQAVDLDVIVLFSNHCFTRGLMTPDELVDESLIIMDGSERRVLDRERYQLSRQYLPQLILELPTRHVQVADPTRPNFVTFELPSMATGEPSIRYAVFFEVKRDRKRKRRVLLRVQSAYILDEPSNRLLKADKMRFQVILKRAYA